MSTPPLDPGAMPAAPPTSPAGNGAPYVPDLPPEVVPDVSVLVTVDDAPVDSIFAEKQQRLLTEPLYSSWAPPEGKPFLALSNVGYFYAYREPPLVPDALLSLEVTAPPDLDVKEGHSYFQWLMGKPPDVIVEIVSDKRGGEDTHKMRAYARQRVPCYVIFDPYEHLGHGLLRAFHLPGASYEPTAPGWFANVGLGVRLWEGTFEGATRTWLRWCDRDGAVVPTGHECAIQERSRAEEEHRRAEEERRRAEDAENKLQQLAAKHREMGVDPGV